MIFGLCLFYDTRFQLMIEGKIIKKQKKISIMIFRQIYLNNSLDKQD